MAYKASSLSHRVSRSYKTQARLRPRVIQQPATDPNWYVVMTNPRCELRAKGGLEALGYEIFMPTERKTVRVPKHQAKSKMDKLREVDVPMFPRYLFIGFDPEVAPFYPIRLTDGVAAILTNNGAPIRVPTIAIEKLREAQARRDERAKEKASRLLLGALPQVGSMVRLEEGAFAGLHALVTAHARKGVVLEVRDGHRAIEVQMSAHRAIEQLEVVG